VTCSDRDGLTALCWSSLRGQLNSTHLLLERGSNIDHVDKNQRTPLHLASSYGHEQVVRHVLHRLLKYQLGFFHVNWVISVTKI